MNLDKKEITLAANWQTYCELKEKGIDSVLWEDLYTKEKLISLHKQFKEFCHHWYIDEIGRDKSIYDGLSIGQAISDMVYYDSETWIRVFFLFEYIAKNKINCTFWALNKEYFSDKIYQFIDIINKTYGNYLKVKFLEQEDEGMEFSVKRILSFNRNLAQFKKCRFFKVINFIEKFRQYSKPLLDVNIRCLMHEVRNPSIYLNLLNQDKSMKSRIAIYFDTSYTSWRVLFKLMYYRNAVIIDEDIIRQESEIDGWRGYKESVLNVAEKRLGRIDFLDKIGRQFFGDIFKEYIRQTLITQVGKYSYLKQTVKKYRINVTVCGGHDTPESYYLKYLMDKYGGKAFLLPHGLVAKSPEDYPHRAALAHYYFYYSDSEKQTWINNYDISDAQFIPIKFLEKDKRKNNIKHKKVKKIKILILLDNFQVRLCSRINYFRSFRELYKSLNSLGFEDIEIRTHYSFFHCYHRKKIKKKIKDKYFFSLPIHTPYKVALKDIIGKYDIVISNLSTSIYEAICKNVFFIPYAFDYFSAGIIGQITDYEWLPGLYPQISTNLEEVQKVLMGFADSSPENYENFFKSIEKVNLCNQDEIVFWKIIYNLSYI